MCPKGGRVSVKNKDHTVLIFCQQFKLFLKLNKSRHALFRKLYHIAIFLSRHQKTREEPGLSSYQSRLLNLS